MVYNGYTHSVSEGKVKSRLAPSSWGEGTVNGIPVPPPSSPPWTIDELHYLATRPSGRSEGRENWPRTAISAILLSMATTSQLWPLVLSSPQYIHIWEFIPHSTSNIRSWIYAFHHAPWHSFVPRAALCPPCDKLFPWAISFGNGPNTTTPTLANIGNFNIPARYTLF